MMTTLRDMVLLIGLAGAAGAQAGEVQVLAAELRRDPAGTWTASVTLEHADTGWEHYADAWRLVSPAGAVLGVRTLYHPHETEQPFTRQLSGIVIPESLGTVIVEARDNVHGWSSNRIQIDLDDARDGRVRITR